MKRKQSIWMVVFLCILTIITIARIEYKNKLSILEDKQLQFYGGGSKEEIYILDFKEGNKMEVYSTYEAEFFERQKRKSVSQITLSKGQICKINILLNQLSGKPKVSGIITEGWMYYIQKGYTWPEAILVEGGPYGLCSEKENRAVEEILNMAGLSNVIFPVNRDSINSMSVDPKKGFEIFIDDAWGPERSFVFDGKGNLTILEVSSTEFYPENSSYATSVIKKIKLPYSQWRKIRNLAKNTHSVKPNFRGMWVCDGAVSNFFYEGKVIDTDFGAQVGFEVDENYRLLIEEVWKIEQSATET